ncbi:MAG: helix-turn-helix transcriptional regulator [Bacteroidales bacterium]|nr:helix-turn-helix transcriptional regulator [Bacteroidales bacterium]
MNMEYRTLDEMIDLHLGKRGTPVREEFEQEVKDGIETYRHGEAVREARKKQNLTQKQLGERVGVGEAQISKIESGKAATFGTFNRVFRALGATSGTLDLGSLGRISLW